MTTRNYELVKRGNGEVVLDNEEKFEYFEPAISLMENDNSYICMLDIPGADKDTIKLKLDNDKLVVTSSTSISEENIVYSEIGNKHYKRVFNLNNEIDRSRISATYENGVLTIVLPKNLNEIKRIEIK